MTLKKEVLRVQLGQGLDTKSTDILLEPGKLEVLENAVFEKTGKIQKRKGSSSSTWDTSATNDPVGTFAYRDNLIIQGDKGAVTLIGSDNEAFASPGLGENEYFESEVFHASGTTGYHQLQPSIAISHSGDYIGIAHVLGEWDAGEDAIRYSYVVSVLDAVTGTLVNSNRGIANKGSDSGFVGKIKIVAHGSTDAADDSFAIYYEFLSGSDLSIRKAVFAHDVFSISGSDIVAASLYRQTLAEAYFDVVEHTTGAGNYRKVHLVYTKFASSKHYAAYQLDTNGTLGTVAEVDHTSNAMKHMTVSVSSAGGTARIYYAYSIGTSVHFQQRTEADPTAGVFTNSKALTGTVMTESGGWCDSESGSTVEYFCTMGTVSSTFISKSCRMLCTPGATTIDDDNWPFRQNAWMPIAPIKTTTGVHYFLSQENRSTEDEDTSLHTVTAWLDTVIPQAMLGALERGLIGSTFRQELIRNHLNGISARVVTNGTNYFTVLPRTTNLQTWSNTSSGAVTAAINSQSSVIKISVSKPINETSRVQLGGVLFIAPGSIKSTAGDRLHEAGFYYKPGLALAEAAAGSMEADGVYQYRACWEWEDSFGNLHRSEPSAIETLTLTGTNTGVTVTSDALSMSVKGISAGGGLNLVLYRTQDAGNVFNRVATLINPPLDSSITGSPIISHHDKVSDANAATGTFLYTEGGELANVAPPPSRYIEAHRNRIFAITEDNRVWFSKEYENKFGLGWSDFFQVAIDGLDHDKPTALCSSGSDIVIFRERSTWAVSGEGPSKTGVGEYYKPRQLSAVIGALKNTPTIYTDDGIYFQNTRGIFRLKEDFEYIGSPVEDLVGDSQVICIRAHQKTETVRFAFSDKVLAYNYRYEIWSNYTYSLAVDETIIGMENLDDVMHVVTSDDKILKEDSSYKVGSNYIVLKVKTGWISLNEIQGFGRAYRFSILGTSHDKHILTAKVYYNYDDDSTPDTYTFTSTSASDVVLQFRAHLKKQKCEAIKFEIYDADNSASVGDGFSIDHIAIEIGTKKGIFRTSESNTIGAS